MGDYSCGCFAGNMSQEIGDTCPTLSLATKEVTEELKSVFKGCIQEAIVSGEIDADCDADTITEFIYNSWQGAILSMKSSKSSVPIDAFMEIVFKKLIH
jgi:TetR/AcrR family transcriptional repressor of nem operon